jgi:hypothetical protein
VLKESLEKSRGVTGDATSDALEGMAVALRTIVSVLEVLESGEFKDREGTSVSEVRSRAQMRRLESFVSRHDEGMKLLKAASFALDVMLPGPVEIVWKLFVRGGHYVADGMDETKCRCEVV